MRNQPGSNTKSSPERAIPPDMDGGHGKSQEQILACRQTVAGHQTCAFNILEKSTFLRKSPFLSWEPIEMLFS